MQQLKAVASSFGIPSVIMSTILDLNDNSASSDELDISPSYASFHLLRIVAERRHPKIFSSSPSTHMISIILGASETIFIGGVAESAAESE